MKPRNRLSKKSKAASARRAKPLELPDLSEPQSAFQTFRAESGTLTSKGQTTIPKWIRDQLKLKAGDALTYMLDGGRIIIRPKNRSIKDLGNVLPKPSRVATLEDMEKAIAQEVMQRDRYRY